MARKKQETSSQENRLQESPEMAQEPNDQKSRQKKSQENLMKLLEERLQSLDQASDALSRDLQKKKERRQKLPEIVPGEQLLAMAQLNHQITEAESLLASQRGLLHSVHNFLDTHEQRVTDLMARIEDLEKRQQEECDLTTEQLKDELTALLGELNSLRTRREQISRTRTGSA